MKDRKAFDWRAKGTKPALQVAARRGCAILIPTYLPTSIYQPLPLRAEGSRLSDGRNSPMRTSCRAVQVSSLLSGVALIAMMINKSDLSSFSASAFIATFFISILRNPWIVEVKSSW